MNKGLRGMEHKNSISNGMIRLYHGGRRDVSIVCTEYVLRIFLIIEKYKNCLRNSKHFTTDLVHILHDFIQPVDVFTSHHHHCAPSGVGEWHKRSNFKIDTVNQIKPLYLRDSFFSLIKSRLVLSLFRFLYLVNANNWLDSLFKIIL